MITWTSWTPKPKTSVFSNKAAARVKNFIQTQVRVPSGEGAAELLKLRPWQEEIIDALFGTLNEDGFRQYRHAFIFLAARNGKSAIMAAIGLYMLFRDGELNGQVLIGANSQKQAENIFRYCQQIIMLNKSLKDRVRILEKEKKIIDKQTGSVLMALSAESANAYGLNASCVILDEVAHHRDNRLHDSLITRVGSRKQPLIVMITTASTNHKGIGKQKYDYAKKVASGEIVDPTFYSYIREVPMDADIFDEANWYAANPALGDFRDLEEMRVLARQAKNDPAVQIVFRTNYLNQWVTASSSFIDSTNWDRCGTDFDERELEGLPAFMGVDLAVSEDFCAVVLIVPKDGRYFVVPRLFLTGEDLNNRAIKDAVPYDAWRSEQHIVVTPGSMHDLEFIESEIVRLTQTFRVNHIAMDPAHGVYMAQRLRKAGINVQTMGQGFAHMSNPMQSLKALIDAGTIAHPKNPALDWMIRNLSYQMRGDGLVRPLKVVKTQRIDGASALIFATDQLLRHEHDEVEESQNFEDSVLGRYGLIVV